MLLGQTLYDDYVANPTDEKWVKFVEGYTFTVDYAGLTINVCYRGLTNTDKVSIISDYLFCKIMLDKAATSTNVGVVVPNVENGTRVPANYKTAAVWNRMRQLYGYLNQSKIEPSAYNFIRYAGYEFNNWIFTEIEERNAWGL